MKVVTWEYFDLGFFNQTDRDQQYTFSKRKDFHYMTLKIQSRATIFVKMTIHPQLHYSQGKYNVNKNYLNEYTQAFFFFFLLHNIKTKEIWPQLLRHHKNIDQEYLVLILKKKKKLSQYYFLHWKRIHPENKQKSYISGIFFKMYFVFIEFVFLKGPHLLCHILFNSAIK